MPKTGLPQRRRDALIQAAIGAIHGEGSLDVTMAAIAGRAAVSPALAHHYFGAKDDLMIAAMRHLLGAYRAGVTRRLKAAETPRARVSAILWGSFEAEQVSGEAVAAWLVFYLHARRNAAAARLIAIYFARLDSNLVAALRPLVGREAARTIADATGAMIDGLWLRQALASGRGTRARRGPDSAAAIAAIERFIDAQTARAVIVAAPERFVSPPK